MAIELSRLVKDLPEILTNRKVTPELQEIREAFWGAFAFKFFKEAHKNFKMRSKGGSDNHGQSWKDISKKTKAYRPRNTRNKGRGLLTAKQDSEWKKIFARYFKKFVATMSEPQAKEQAAKIAWTVLKKQGAKTKIDVYGSKDAKILVRSGRLQASLKAGKFTGDTYMPSGPDQQFEFNKGRIKLGTKVPYASEVGETRPIFGDESALIDEAMAYAIDKLSKKLKQL
jgi:hypothetical protein